jgi:hypothetical protein
LQSLQLLQQARSNRYPNFNAAVSFQADFTDALWFGPTLTIGFSGAPDDINRNSGRAQDAA